MTRQQARVGEHDDRRRDSVMRPAPARYSRIDVRLDAAGKPNVVEVNPLPRILPNPADNSCFPKAARAAGMSYDELIQACLLHAAEQQGVSLGIATSGVATAAMWR